MKEHGGRSLNVPSPGFDQEFAAGTNDEASREYTNSYSGRHGFAQGTHDQNENPSAKEGHEQLNAEESHREAQDP